MTRSICNVLFTVGMSLGVLSCAWETQAGLLLNGSFEDASVHPSPSPDGFIALTTGTEITSWTANPGYFWYATNPANGFGEGDLFAQNGSYFLNLAQTDTMSSQSFAVIGGFPYEVSYYEYSRLKTTDAALLTTVSLAAGTGGTSQLASSSFNDGWTLHNFFFTPSVSTTATLTFTSGNIPADGLPYLIGTYLDSASVNLVPEPSSVVLFGLGAVGLALLARKRRKA